MTNANPIKITTRGVEGHNVEKILGFLKKGGVRAIKNSVKKGNVKRKCLIIKNHRNISKIQNCTKCRKQTLA